jgi:hypothetical protein
LANIGLMFVKGPQVNVAAVEGGLAGELTASEMTASVASVESKLTTTQLGTTTISNPTTGQTLMRLRDEALATTRKMVAQDLADGIQTTPQMFGNYMDAIFKANVLQAQEQGLLSQTLRVTPPSMNQPGIFGIDVWDPAIRKGWDVTTATVREVAGHDARYIGSTQPDGTVLQEVDPLVYTR